MHKHTGLMMGFLLVVAMASVDAWACRDDIAASAPDSRFRDNGDGTVSDLSAGLMWKQCPEGLGGADCSAGSLDSLSWKQALQRGVDATDAGYPDWRLPNRNELASLLEQRCYTPSINRHFFPNTPSSAFWSSSSEATNPRDAWNVAFGAGGLYYVSKSATYYVRLVRGGQ